MTNPYLHIINPSADCKEFPSAEELACPFPFPLDPFQKHAVLAIHRGENVLVTAKTGSGKTLVGEYLIHHMIRQGKRVFYTTPIKSLSNQKFHDLKQMFPSVGIMTGDIKYRPDAQIVIMTTEILRNLLYKNGTPTASLGLTAQISLEGLGGVVFDEVHYINDKERGKVWEETMILLDPTIQLVLLSATIDRPDLFAAWLGNLKQKPIHLISTNYRIVPLTHSVFIEGKPELIMDNKEIFYDSTYRKWLDWRDRSAKQKDIHKRQVADRKLGGYEDPVVKRAAGLAAFPAQLNECVRYLDTHGLMPALFFVFSRAGCEKYASLVEGSLISTTDSAAIQHIWDFHLHPYRSILEHLPQAHALLDLVKRGIAFHHSGLLPILREMVEILFGKGLLKVLFATETFAVGINMPTKTVVFLDAEKYTDEVAGGGIRTLRTDEYIQMAGRAGRRGKDTQGYVFYLPQREPIDVGEAKLMLTGKKSAIVSRMDFGYDFLLKTLQSKNLRWTSIMESSYWEQQRIVERAALVELLEQKKKRLAEYQISESLQKQCEQREDAEMRWKTSVNAAKKEAQKELDRLRNKQVGPAWENAWRMWQTIKAIKKDIQGLEQQIEDLSVSYEMLLAPRFRCLQGWGFLTEENELTTLGTLATEINEGHPILMSIAFQEKLVHSLSQEEFVAFLAGHLTESKMENEPYLDDVPVSKAVQSALWTMNEYAEEYEKEEGALANAKFWRLSTGWIEIMSRWMQGDDPAVLCSQFGVYEGNLMRSVLKVSNMVEEWINMATWSQDVEWLKAMEGIQQKLVRGIAKPDSLYLRL